MRLGSGECRRLTAVSISFMAVLCLLVSLPDPSLAAPPWTPMGPYGGTVTALARDAADPDVVFAGTDRSGVWKSADGGRTWSDASLNLPFGDVYQTEFPEIKKLTVSASGDVYAVTDIGLFETPGNAVSWSTVGQPPGSGMVVDLAFDGTDPGILYASMGVNGSGVFKSENGGGWTPVNNQLTDTRVSCVLTDPTSPGRLLAMSRSGLFYSENGADSWSLVSGSLLYVSSVYALHARVEDPQSISVEGASTVTAVSPVTALYAATSSSVYRMQFPGPWTAFSNGIPTKEDVFWIGDGPGGELYAATEGGLRRFDAGANAWTLVSGHPAVKTFVALPGAAEFLTGGDYGVQRTADGSLYGPSNEGMLGLYVMPLLFHPENPNILYVGTSAQSRAGVFKSEDGGLTWTQKNQGLTNRTITSLALDPNNPDVMYAGTLGSGLFKSLDAGENWFLSSNGFAFEMGTPIVNTIRIDPRNSNRVYAAVLSRGGGVYRSDDAGESWIRLTEGIPPSPLDPIENEYFAIFDIEFHPYSASSIYITTGGCAGGVAVSVDEGLTWTFINNGMPDPYYVLINTVTINPADPDEMWASGVDQGLWHSTNAGGTWTLVPGTPAQFPTGAALDPADPSKVYVSGLGGVRLVTDGGASVTPIGEGLENHVVTNVTFDPRNDRVLYAGSARRGLYRLNLDGVPVRIAGFTATPLPSGAISLEWQALDARDHLGFHLYRAEAPEGVAPDRAAYRRITTSLLRGESPDGEGSFRFDDTETSPGATYAYLLADIDRSGRETFHGPIFATLAASVPARLALFQSRPNPLRSGSISIDFQLPVAGSASLRIFDGSGRLVRTLLDGRVPGGLGSVGWDGTDEEGRPVANGVYHYQLRTPVGVENRKLVLSRE